MERIGISQSGACAEATVSLTRQCLWSVVNAVTSAVVALCACCSILTPSACRADGAPELSLGTVVSDEMGGAAYRDYRIAVHTGEFFRVIVDKRGIDVTVKLLTPAGDSVAQSHGFWGAKGHEAVGAVADATGSYTIRVMVYDPAESTGHFTVLLDTRRAATPRDREWLNGLASASRARQLIENTTTTDETTCTAALRDLSTSLDFFERSLDAREIMVLHQQLGFVYELCDVEDAAYFHSFRAIEYARTIGDADAEAGGLNRIGFLYIDFGYLAAARSQLEGALQLSRKHGNPWDEASAQEGLARIASEAGSYDQALALLKSALAAEALSNKAQYGTLLQLGDLHLKFGNTSAAMETFVELYKKVEALAQRHGRTERQSAGARAMLARTLVGMTTTAIRMKQMGRAKNLLGQARKNAPDERTIAYIKFLTAYIEYAEGAVTTLAAYEDTLLGYIFALEGKRDTFSLFAGRMAHTARLRSYYDLLVDALMHDRTANNFGLQYRAADIAERSRSAVYANTSTNVENDANDTTSRHLRVQARRIRAQISEVVAKDVRAIADISTAASPVGEALQELLRQYDQVELALADYTRRHNKSVEVPPVTIQEIQKDLLDDRTVVLSYWFTGDHGYCWIITKRAIRTFLLPDRVTILRTARILYPQDEAEMPSQKRLADGSWDEVLRRLAALVLKPAEPEIRGKRTVVVGDGPIHFIPFAALPIKGEDGTTIPLIMNGPVVTVPSCAIVLRSGRRSQRETERAWNVAVFADPVFSTSDPRVRNGVQTHEWLRGVPTADRIAVTRAGMDAGLGANALPRLPFTRAEAESIRRAFGNQNSVVLTGFNATLERLLESYREGYNVLHLATHGFVNRTRPELSGVALSLVDETGKSIPGFLRVAELFETRAPFDLVVLSACRSALGWDYGTGELVGPTHALLYAGAKQVISTLWPVDDAATATLMDIFYTFLAADPKHSAEIALRRAQLKFRESPSWNSPYFWAGFTLSGDWQ